MFETTNYSKDQTKNYELLLKQLDALLTGETDNIANLANAAALLNQFFDQINWVGFYIWDATDEELILGPFQGLPACVRIPFGKGVCGTAVETREIQRVPDVHAFKGHIACDSTSQSEIVLPLLIGGSVYGVLDIDSPILDRFDEVDEANSAKFCHVLIKHLHA